MSSSCVTPVARPEVIALMDSIQNGDILWDNKKYSDLTINCKGKEWKVHRSIICTQSRPLAVMIDGVWKEGQEGIINLDNDEPAIVEKMIHFCYKADYNDDRYTLTNRELDEDIAALRQNPETLAGSELDLLLLSRDYRNTGSEEDPGGPLVTNAKVYILGDKYDIPALKKFAASMYKEESETSGTSQPLLEVRS